MTGPWYDHDGETCTDAIYEEFVLEGARVVMISDVANENAWIQSDVTVPCEP